MLRHFLCALVLALVPVVSQADPFQPRIVVDERCYWSRYGDVFDQYKDTMTASQHYEQIGRFEGREARCPTQVDQSPNMLTLQNGMLRVQRDLSRYGGAIVSLRVRGRETVNNLEKGRQIQFAWFEDGLGECANPTEAGGLLDNYSARTTSQVITYNSSAEVMSTLTRPAHWTPGSYPACAGSGRPALSRSTLHTGTWINPNLGGVVYPNVVQLHYMAYDTASVKTMEVSAHLVGAMERVGRVNAAGVYYEFGQQRVPGIDAYWYRETGANEDPVIAYTADQSTAVALMRPKYTNLPCERRRYNSALRVPAGEHESPYTTATTKLNVAAETVGCANPYSIVVWVVTGTLGEVINTVNALRRF